MGAREKKGGPEGGGMRNALEKSTALGGAGGWGGGGGKKRGARGGRENEPRGGEPHGLGRPRGLLALARLLPVCPLFERFPVGVVLGLELPAAVVEGVAARLGRERHEQKAARGEVAGNHQFGDRLEVAARLFLGPELGSRREVFQAGSGVSLHVTDVP